MVKIIEKRFENKIPEELLEGKRHLTAEEIEVLEKNLNHNTDKTWSNVYVPAEQGKFDVSFRKAAIFRKSRTRKSLMQNTG